MPVNVPGDNHSEILHGMPVFVRRGTVWLLVACLAVIAGLLYFGRVHVVVAAAGKILPEGDVLVIQARRPGIVNTILARAGDHLEAGAIIAKLDTSETGATLAELKGQLQLQESTLIPVKNTLSMVNLVLAKPEAFFNGQQPLLPTVGNSVQLIMAVGDAKSKLDGAEGAVKYWPDQKKSVEDEITAARETFKAYEDTYKIRVSLYDANVKGLEQKRKNLENFRKLSARGLMSPMELQGEEERMVQTETQMLEEKQRFSQLHQELNQQKQQLKNTEDKMQNEPGTRAYAVTAAKALLDQAKVNLKQDRDRMDLQARELETSIAALKDKVRAAEAQVALTSVIMPVKGVIAEIRLNGAGQVVAAGAPVAAILPEGVPLVVYATVANKDSGFVHPGLDARVKVDAYPFQHYGTVPARVSAVLPSVGAGNTFTVKLQLLDTSLHPARGAEERMFPGLTVQAELITARVRVLDLLFSSGLGASFR